MKKVLTQDEIDALLGRAGGEVADRHNDRVEPCDFRNAGQVSEQHAGVMTSLYEGLARNASHPIGA